MKERHLFATLCTALTSSDLDDSIVEEIFADEVFTRHIEALNYLVDQAEGAECNEFLEKVTVMEPKKCISEVKVRHLF